MDGVYQKHSESDIDQGIFDYKLKGSEVYLYHVQREYWLIGPEIGDRQGWVVSYTEKAECPEGKSGHNYFEFSDILLFFQMIFQILNLLGFLLMAQNGRNWLK